MTEQLVHITVPDDVSGLEEDEFLHYTCCRDFVGIETFCGREPGKYGGGLDKSKKPLCPTCRELSKSPRTNCPMKFTDCKFG